MGGSFILTKQVVEIFGSSTIYYLRKRNNRNDAHLVQLLADKKGFIV
jgi:hypothetical protein